MKAQDNKVQTNQDNLKSTGHAQDKSMKDLITLTQQEQPDPNSLEQKEAENLKAQHTFDKQNSTAAKVANGGWFKNFFSRKKNKNHNLNTNSSSQSATAEKLSTAFFWLSAIAAIGLIICLILWPIFATLTGTTLVAGSGVAIATGTFAGASGLSFVAGLVSVLVSKFSSNSKSFAHSNKKTPLSNNLSNNSRSVQRPNLNTPHLQNNSQPILYQQASNNLYQKPITEEKKQNSKTSTAATQLSNEQQNINSSNTQNSSTMSQTAKLQEQKSNQKTAAVSRA